MLCSCAQAPKKFAPASTVGVHNKIAEVRTNIASANKEASGVKADIARARELGKDNKELTLALDSASRRIDSLTADLLKATSALGAADTRLVDADKKTQSEFNRANKMAESYDKMAKRYHRLKFPLCTIGAGAAGLLLWKFKIPLLALGWIGIGIMVASPLAVFGLLWAIL